MVSRWEENTWEFELQLKLKINEVFFFLSLHRFANTISAKCSPSSFNRLCGNACPVIALRLLRRSANLPSLSPCVCVWRVYSSKNVESNQMILWEHFSANSYVDLAGNRAKSTPTSARNCARVYIGFNNPFGKVNDWVSWTSNIPV
jgi:hypothetical protein